MTSPNLNLLNCFLVAMVVPWLSSACAGEMDSQGSEAAERLRAGLAALADQTPQDLLAGKQAFEVRCASCHGQAAGGSDVGPPLVHDFYKPSHHADMAFFFAIQRGVRAHHWRFGDMPSVVGVDQREAEQVVAYVRWLQRGTGIE